MNIEGQSTVSDATRIIKIKSACISWPSNPSSRNLRKYSHKYIKIMCEVVLVVLKYVHKFFDMPPFKRAGPSDSLLMNRMRQK